MDNLAKGGRGKRAPYSTVMCRVPEPLKDLVDELTSNYRHLVNDYQDCQDADLITAVVNTLATGENNQLPEQLLQDYQQMLIEIERLNEQINQLKLTRDTDIISKALLKFIETKKKTFGKNPSQKNKEFSLKTRQWDALREFMQFINN